MRYDDLTREQAINLLIKRDTQRKLGLVWEREEIDQDAALNSDFVVMDLNTAGGSCGIAPYRNLVIEGDNFDALRWLRMTHAGQIKVIYIDPPYNTGNRDWVYNDNYVDPNDRFRHSKWLEWLHQRLSVARDLLTPDGVILVSINDDNRAKLELLMDETFPGMRIGSFAWKTRNGTFADGGRMFSADHEHVLVYGGPSFGFHGVKKNFDNYTNTDDERGPWRSGPITQPKTMVERPNAYYPIQDPDTGIWYPCNPARVWAYATEERVRPGTRLRAESMEQLIATKRVLFPRGARAVQFDTIEALLEASRNPEADFPRDARGAPLLFDGLPDLEWWVGKQIGIGAPQMKIFRSELGSDRQPLSSWITPRSEADDDTNGLVSGYNQDGTKLLRGIFNNDVFSYPKPLSLLTELLRQTTGPGDIVLDFFAGSGTTAHAVLALNAEDNNGRRFIMVSNRERAPRAPDRNVCLNVCAERIRRVINGYGTVAGLPGDFAYLVAERIDFESLFRAMAMERTWVAIQAMHGLPIEPADPDQPIQSATGKEGTMVLYCDRFTEAAEEALNTLTSGKAAIVYAYMPGPVRDAFIGNDRVEVRGVSEELLRRFRA